MNKHIPVLLSETLEILNVQPNHWYLDATFGRGGHTQAILEKGGNVIAFDWDSEAITFGKEKFTSALKNKRLFLIEESFAKITPSLEKLNSTEKIGEISGVLFDFGTSTEQLKSSQRGFSFEGDGPLDMRMNLSLGVTASDLLIAVPESQLAKLFIEYGGEKNSKAIAKAIKNSPKPIKTTTQLRDLIERINKNRAGKLHPATKVFQALRIAVNSELDQIEVGLPQGFSILKSGGKLVTIAFHEGEDRIAKNFLKNLITSGQASNFIRKTASEGEIEENPRSRSAQLRSIVKI